MTKIKLTPTLQGEPASDVEAVFGNCKRRILEREGIPMFLALHDARPGRSLVVNDATAKAEGGTLTRLFEHYEQGVDALSSSKHLPIDTPPEVDETGAADLIDVLVVLSDQHLRARLEDGA